MMTRSEIAERKATLLDDLRASYRAGEGMPGGEGINQRELSVRYGISIRTVSIALKDLAQEGVLYTVPRVGTFLGRLPSETAEPYLLISRKPRSIHVYVDQVQAGFEDRIAHLGGASHALATEDPIWPPLAGDLPPIAGMFHYASASYASSPDKDRVPSVFFHPEGDEKQCGDSVDFDDENGGAQATRHLLSMGHRHIAFLALHNPEVDAGAFSWSLQRESGWKQMMCSAGQDTRNLAFHPSPENLPTVHSQSSAACDIAAELLKKSHITAVIAVNAHAAHGLLKALAQANTPVEKWPAIVCFDDTPGVNAAGVSYLRLPWEKIGAEAAQLLWERKTGRLTGPPQRRLIKMHLIRRLTCRTEWARSSRFVNRQAADMESLNRKELQVAGV